MNRQGIGLWIVVVALLILDIGVHCVRAQDDSAKLVKTQHLQIVDSSGNVVADFDTDKNSEPELAMYDEQGNGRLGLFGGKDGGELTMFDTDSKRVIDLQGSDQPDLTFFQAGNAKADIGIDDNKGASLAFYDQDTKMRSYIGYNQSDDQSSLALWDQTRNLGVFAFSNKDADAVVSSDSKGMSRLILGCTSDNQAGIGLFDTGGKALWREGDMESSIGDDNSPSEKPGRERHTIVR